MKMVYRRTYLNRDLIKNPMLPFEDFYTKFMMVKQLKSVGTHGATDLYVWSQSKLEFHAESFNPVSMYSFSF